MAIKNVAVLLKYYNGELNPFDQATLECALLTGATVTVVAMAPLSVKEQMQGLTRLGVNALLVSDIAYAGSDTLATSLVLSKAIERLNPDVIFCGRQSVDGDTSQVPPMIAKRLNFKIITKVMDFDGQNYKTRLGNQGVLEQKTVYTFERIKTLRFPSLFSKAKEVEVLDNRVLGLPKNQVGALGSPTQVVKTYQSQVGRRFCKFISVEDLTKIIQESLSKKADFETKENLSNQMLDKVFYLGDIEKSLSNVAKTAVKIEWQGKTAEEIVNQLNLLNAETVFFSDDEKLKILASEIAVLTNSGLTADCISLSVNNKKLVMTRPAHGGDITADIVCNSKITLATLRTAKKGDAKVIFSVGKGAIKHIEKIKEYAKIFNAEVCASRIVVDDGKMPYQSQVGLTGKSVAPKVYVAFGISGAVQHTCAIPGAQTVIAINVDKSARIFDYADYGIISSIEEII